MNIYELILVGYNGKTDETDDLILWVEAENRKALNEAIGLHSDYVRTVSSLDDHGPEDFYDAIDFSVSEHNGNLSDVIGASFNKVHGHKNLYTNTYFHCEEKWELDGCSMHNDRCPVCEKEIEPKRSEPLFN